MWVLVQEDQEASILLESQPNGTPSQVSFSDPLDKWGLMPGQTYSLGRMNSDITTTSDTSVSKSHATITVRPGRGSARPEVILEDVGSKFGIHLNDGILAGTAALPRRSAILSKSLKEPYSMKDNDRVRLGVAYTIFRLIWSELHVTSSMMRTRDKQSLVEMLKKIDSRLELESQMTDTTTHLVMDRISVSSKVVRCLAKCVPIVTSEYFRDLVECLNTRQKLPPESAYLPPVAETELQLKDQNISFCVNPARGKVLEGKTFVFLSEEQYRDTSDLCRLAGGRAVLWSKEADMETITASHVVIKPPASVTQRAKSQDMVWGPIASALKDQDRVSVSQTDVFLAIVHCSTDFYCNTER